MDHRRLNLTGEAGRLLEAAPATTVATRAEQLFDLSVRDAVDGWHEVAYRLPDGERIVEARVCRTRNGVSANYLEPYMRRRDPDCLLIGDERPTNKMRYAERFAEPFDAVRQQTFAWLAEQELAALAFTAGVGPHGMPAVAICPANAGFFALGLALLQGILGEDEVGDDFEPEAVVFVAPPFRHTHFEGKQIVVHNRASGLQELFSYNLYPGPSAKKGIYGVLIDLGEREGWITAHCATVRVVTPYDLDVTIMHEGASGGGKSEMLERVHREEDGRLLLGENIVTGERRHLPLPRACDLLPVTDDMALCPTQLQDGHRKLSVMDAEDAWFVRVNHIDHYGMDPHLERLTVDPPEPLLFLNIDAVPDGRALIWEHVEDAPGRRCPNPRVVLPRRAVPGVVDGAVAVDIRSFGVRTPPCTKDDPSYGILGLLHVLPPALAWLWRLVAPRGYANPSIVDTEAMTSEGVGSYWPFATGRRVDQANLLLRQIASTTDTLFVLIPNQHVGAWKTGFMPQWLVREYLARRAATAFRPDQLEDARCPLLGRTVVSLQVEGTLIGHWFLRVHTQPEVGEEAYDAGAEQLSRFFREQLANYVEPDLHPLGRRIVENCLEGGDVASYDAFFADPEAVLAGFDDIPAG